MNPLCHDLVCILSVGLRKLIGTNNTSDVSPEIIERALRLSYEYDHFKQSLLFQEIVDWECKNVSFKVFKTH